MADKQLGIEPVIDQTASVTRSTLGRYTEIGARTLITETRLGDYSYAVQDCEIIHAEIGRFVSIASHVRINPGNHPMERASQSHFTYRASSYFAGEEDEPDFFDRRRQRPVTIGHDVWVGHGAIILPGRIVGTGSVIGAGSVVTRDVAPYDIVAGNPARTIRPRFAPDVAGRMAALAWWNWDHETLRARLPDFRTLSAEAFLNRHEGCDRDISTAR